LCTQNAIHVVDRAFIGDRFWEQCQQHYASTVITRMKSTLKYTVIQDNEIAADSADNDGVLFDRQIRLQSAKGVMALDRVLCARWCGL